MSVSTGKGLSDKAQAYLTAIERTFLAIGAFLTGQSLVSHDNPYLGIGAIAVSGVLAVIKEWEGIAADPHFAGMIDSMQQMYSDIQAKLSLIHQTTTATQAAVTSATAPDVSTSQPQTTP